MFFIKKAYSFLFLINKYLLKSNTKPVFIVWGMPLKLFNETDGQNNVISHIIVIISICLMYNKGIIYTKYLYTKISIY